MNTRTSACVYTALIVFLLFFGAVDVAAEALPGEALPLRAVPGEVLIIEQPAPLEAIELTGPDGQSIGRYRSFRTEGRNGGEGGLRVLIPLSSLMDPGQYELRFYNAAGSMLDIRPLEITRREFRSETIQLNYSLSELRSSDDPRKYDQAVAIQKIYATFNADQVLGSANLRLPLPKRDSGKYRITSHYGDRRIFSYSDESTARSIHTGIDFAADVGTPVLAAGQGRVVLAADRIISGYSVVIEHLPGVYTVYFHLDQLEVDRGDLVNTSQRIGTVGMSGLATGPHLHWEVRVHGVAVDPGMLTQLE